MAEQPDRPGVTSSIYDRYAQRTADSHASFLLPHIEPGMNLIDVGCGLGSITLGLAEAVAPGHVVGVDLNEDAIAKAQDTARERGINNVTFRVGSCYELPFADATFDAAFAHMVLMHLDDPARATTEVWRVLKDGGVFGSGERAEQGDVRGNTNPTIERSWRIFMKWQQARGSDLSIGARLPELLHTGGFSNVEAAPSFDGSTLEEYMHQYSTFFSSDSLAKQSVEQGWATQQDLRQIRDAIGQWGADRNTFWGMARVDAVAWKA